MKTLFIISISLLTSIVGLAQEPILTNYPLVLGHYRDAVIEDDIMYCLTDYGIISWNIENPSNPKFVSKLATQSWYTTGKIEEFGNALIIQRSDTIFLVDKSDPQSLAFIPFNEDLGYLNDIAILDSSLFIARNATIGLLIYDISDINNPTLDTTLNLPFIDNLTQSDQYIFAQKGNTIYRLNTSNGLVTIIDEITVTTSIRSFAANENWCVISTGDPNNFDEFLRYEVYDVSSIGNPILFDSTSISTTSPNNVLTIKDSLVFIESSDVLVYKLSNNGISVTDTLNSKYPLASLSCFDSLVVEMNGNEGFRIHKKQNPTNFEIIGNKKGDWIEQLEVSESGDVFAIGQDSVYIFHKSRSTSELFGDFSFKSVADEITIIDNYLLESQIGNNSTMQLSDIASLPDIDTLSTFQNHGSSHLLYFRIWNERLYNRYAAPGQTMSIYDISDPINPVLLSSGLNLSFDISYNNRLFRILENSIDLYDPTTATPTLINSIDSVKPNCPSWLYWEKDREIGHLLGPNHSCYYQIDLSDLSNIHYSESRFFDAGAGTDIQKAEIADSILYFPGVLGNDLYIFDVCDIEHFRKILKFDVRGFIQDIAVVDKTLFISYGGFIASYDINALEPCLILGNSELETQNTSLNIYPNPNSGSFFIDAPFDLNRIQIYNQHGQVLYSETERVSAVNLKQIETKLNSGIYILQLTSDNEQQYSFKLVIEN